MSIIYSVELPPGFINITVSSPATADTQHKGRRGKLGCLACTKVAGNLTLQPPSCVPSLHLYPTTPYWSLTGTCHSLARTNTTKCCSSESCSECGGPGGVFKEIQVGVENFIVWQCEDCLPIQHPGVTGGVALETTSLFFLPFTLYLYPHILLNNFSSLVYWVAPPVARVTTNSSCCCSAPLLPLSRAILLSQAARTGSQQSGACIPSISIKLVQQTNQTFFYRIPILDRMFHPINRSDDL